MSVLICGGAGYIGSHNVRALLDRGESVVVLDNLWTGHRESLPGSVPFYEGDVRDAALYTCSIGSANRTTGRIGPAKSPAGSMKVILYFYKYLLKK